MKVDELVVHLNACKEVGRVICWWAGKQRVMTGAVQTRHGVELTTEEPSDREIHVDDLIAQLEKPMNFDGEATNTLDVLIAADQYGGPYTVYAPTVFREVICIQTTKPKPEMVMGKSNMRGFGSLVYTDLGYGYGAEVITIKHNLEIGEGN